MRASQETRKADVWDKLQIDRILAIAGDEKIVDPKQRRAMTMAQDPRGLTAVEVAALKAGSGVETLINLLAEQEMAQDPDEPDPIQQILELLKSIDARVARIEQQVQPVSSAAE